MADDLDRLEALAQRVPPSPWRWDARHVVDATGLILATQASPPQPLTPRAYVLAYIAATDPATVLALIARVRAAEARVREADSVEMARETGL